MTLSCYERALSLAEDDNMADIWYNIGQVAIGIGDLGLAYQAFKVSISLNPKQADSFNNLGVSILFLKLYSIFFCQVLELRKGNKEHARSNFQTASSLSPVLFDPLYNEGKKKI
jgi:tetratricopeptide repeat protein 8